MSPGRQPFDGIEAALRRLRERKGWTLAQAGSEAHVDVGNLSRYESGEVSPTLGVLGRLLVAYDTDVHGLADLLAPPKSVTAKPEPADDPFLAAVAGALERLGFASPSADKEPDEPRLRIKNGTRR
jgi:transcriptional regulator with XRE-family HTH domain